MRTPQLWHLIAACAALYAGTLPAAAQPASPDAAPPQLELLEEGEEPAITIRRPEQRQKITEKRTRSGRVTEIQVESGNSTYYLKPDETGGSDGNTLRGAQWQILQFDLRRTDEAAEAAATPPPPDTLSTPPAK